MNSTSRILYKLSDLPAGDAREKYGPFPHVHDDKYRHIYTSFYSDGKMAFFQMTLTLLPK